MTSTYCSKVIGFVGALRVLGVLAGECFALALGLARLDTLLVVHDALLDVASLEHHERHWSARDVGAGRAAELAALADLLAPVLGDLVLGQRVHVVFRVDRVDVLVQAELGVVDDVEPLLRWRHTSLQGGVWMTRIPRPMNW